MIATTTPAEIVRVVRELAAASPDCKYAKPTDAFGSCKYGDGSCSNGSVGCIVGQALGKLGYDQAELDNQGGDVEDLLVNIGVCASDETDSADVWWLRCLQSYQDNQFTWGEAVKLADEGQNYYDNATPVRSAVN